MSKPKECEVSCDEKCNYASIAAKEAVQQTFAILGVDVDDPRQIEEFRKDLRFGGDFRKTMEKGRMAFAATLAGAFVWLLVAGIVAKIKGAS